MSVVDIYDLNKKYGVIYTDPPWPQTKGNIRKIRPHQVKNLDYMTLSLSEIANIQEMVSSLCLDKHNVFMWAIDKYLWDAEQMMKSLGYKLHARMIWDKTNGVAPAFTVRFSHEYLLWFYKKGHMLMPQPSVRGKYTTVFSEQSTVHSRKPECVYDMIDDMFLDVPKLELFARQKRDGWDCWGNEV